MKQVKNETHLIADLNGVLQVLPCMVVVRAAGQKLQSLTPLWLEGGTTSLADRGISLCNQRFDPHYMQA